MMRKVSCTLWAYNKNNSNINMMVSYKIILFSVGPLTDGLL